MNPFARLFPTSHGIAAVAIDGPVVLSASAAWCYFRLDTTSTRWKSGEDQLNYLSSLAHGLASYAGHDLHLVVAHRLVDPDQWAAELHAATVDTAAGWDTYLAGQAHRIADYDTKEIYLGVRLGDRRDAISPLRWVTRQALTKTGLDDPTPPKAEQQRWRSAAERLHQSLAGSAWTGRLATADELRWLIARSVWRGIDEPPIPAGHTDTWGTGELDYLTESLIDNSHPRRLRLDQPAGESYVAMMTLAKFPHALGQAGWISSLDRLDADIDVSMRMHIMPSATALGQIRVKLIDAQNQQRHLLEARGRDSSIDEQMYTADQLKLHLEQDSSPIVVASTRLAVAAATAEDLQGLVAEVTAHYRPMGIDAVVPAGDQLALFLEAMPGDDVRIDTYRQWHSPVTIAGSLASTTTELGDKPGTISAAHGQAVPQGLILGDAIEERLHPVHLGLTGLSQIDVSPVLLATGSPGRGKSLATMMLAYHLALEGGRVMLVDPKGDLQNCLNLTGVEVTSIPVHGSKAAGVLDPYHLYDDPAAAAVLAHTVLSMVLPTKLLHDNEALLLRICDQVGRSDHPSMPAVVHALHSHADPNAAALADSIEATANLDMGRLMLGQPTSGDLTATKLGRQAKPGIQIIDVSWLANIGGTGTGTTVGQKLPYTVMYLVTLLVQQLAKRADRSMPAGVLIDEAHRISKTDLGRDLLISLTKLSRAQNVVVMLATQNMADLLDERLMTNVGVHLAFGVNDLPEAGHILKALQVSDTAHSRQDIVALRRGQAVMRDQYGRVGRIQVTPSPEVFRALTTTPPPRRRRDAIHQPDPDRPGTSSLDGAEEPADTGSRMLG